jgi:hypothetical protein
MNNKLQKLLAKVFLLLIVVSTLSSCAKKGYGCPYDLKSPIKVEIPFIK